MTFCVGLVHGESVYLTGDAAITFPHGDAGILQPGHLTSSFSEVPLTGPHGLVVEAGLKLNVIGQNALALAGDIGRARDAIATLRMAYAQTQSIPDWLAVLSSSMDLARGPTFAFLIARVNDGGPELWRWESSRSEPVRVTKFGWIGSLDTWHSEFVEAWALHLSDRNFSEDDMLPCLLAAQQTLVLREALFQHGVGGVVSGLRVRTGVVDWMEDTHYLIIPPGAPKVDSVAVYARGGAVVTSSTFNDERTIFFNDDTDPNAARWLGEWADQVAREHDVGAAKYWIAINPQTFSAAVIKALHVTTQTSCITLERLAGEKYRVGITNNLRDYLDLPRPSGSAPTDFRSCFCDEPRAEEILWTIVHNPHASDLMLRPR